VVVFAEAAKLEQVRKLHSSERRLLFPFAQGGVQRRLRPFYRAAGKRPS